ncbi:MAG: hypothetical protein VCA37_19610 [Roseibacillus sp.]
MRSESASDTATLVVRSVLLASGDEKMKSPVAKGEGIGVSADAFRALIDLTLSCGGSFFLTYHRGGARREQIERAYPRTRIEEFLYAKGAHDPEGRLPSEWWQHHCNLIEGATR